MKEREKSLVKNTIMVAIGKICTQFISFFLLPLYTALLSAEDYGIVDLLNTYISLLIPIFFLQTDQAVFRFLIDVREDENGKKKIITTTIANTIIQIFVYLICFIFISTFVKNEYKYFLMTNVIASMFSNLMLQISRGLGDNKSFSIGSFITGASNIVLNVIFIVPLKMGAYGMLISNLLANILCVFYIFIKKKLYKYISIKEYSKETRKKMYKYSIPLIPNQLSWWIVSTSDRLIISYLLSVAQNGVYAVANKFSSMCITVFNIFNLTWTESASMHIKDKDSSEFFSGIINKSLKLFISLSLGVIACMPFVFKIFITGEEYESAYFQIPILMLSAIFSITVSLFGSIYVALKKSNEIAKTSIIAGIINIIVHLMLIKFIGLYAASISTLIAYLAMSVYRYFDVQKYVKIKIEKKLIYSSLICAILIIVLYYINNKILCIFGLVIIVIFSVKNNFYIIKEIFNKYTSRVNKGGTK